MKQILEKIQENSGLSLGLVVSGMLVAFVFSAAYFTMRQPAQTMEATQANSYGPMGYGRGGSQGSMNGQGGGRNAQNMDSQGFGNSAQGQNLNKENCLMDGCLLVEDAEFPVEALDSQTVAYLEMALADERKALATYEATMDTFGSVRPFINISRAEEHHISMLKALFDKYGVEIPEDDTEVGPLPATLAEVCAVGVQAEIDNDALYQTMLPNIEQEDIATVFTSLARASKEMHLPAFERCAE